MDLVDRRTFLKKSGVTGGAVVTSGFLHTLARASTALAQPDGPARPQALATLTDSPYGALSPVPDQNGDAILALPRASATSPSRRPEKA